MAVLIQGVALAQEAAESNADESWRALVWVKDGNGELIEKVRATPQFALDAIQAEEPWGRDAGMKVLEQFGGQRSAADLDALADALGRLILESPSHGGPSPPLTPWLMPREKVFHLWEFRMRAGLMY